jgi:hypothetical protein
MMCLFIWLDLRMMRRIVMNMNYECTLSWD